MLRHPWPFSPIYFPVCWWPQFFPARNWGNTCHGICPGQEEQNPLPKVRAPPDGHSRPPTPPTGAEPLGAQCPSDTEATAGKALTQVTKTGTNQEKGTRRKQQADEPHCFPRVTQWRSGYPETRSGDSPSCTHLPATEHTEFFPTSAPSKRGSLF